MHQDVVSGGERASPVLLENLDNTMPHLCHSKLYENLLPLVSASFDIIATSLFAARSIFELSNGWHNRGRLRAAFLGDDIRTTTFERQYSNHEI